MKKDDILDKLIDLGLTENESRTYLAMLSLGATTVLRISKATGIRRTTIYPTLDALKNKGLVKEVIQGLRKKYAAENPEKLTSMLEVKRQELQSMIPDLNSLYNSKAGDSVIKYYEGLEAVKGIYDDLLKELRIGDFYEVISNLDKWRSLAPKFFMKYSDKITDLRLDGKIMSPDGELARDFVKHQKNYHRKAVILPPGTELQSDVMITPNKLVIVRLEEPVTAIVIEDKNTIQMQRSVFKIAWESLYRN